MNYFTVIYALDQKATSPLLSSDGSTPLMENLQILKSWVEHFRRALNRPSTISDAAISQLTQVEINVDLDLTPSPPETIRANGYLLVSGKHEPPLSAYVSDDGFEQESETSG
nr:unnamed protein product [Spirometra erinaceieuropaei]